MMEHDSYDEGCTWLMSHPADYQPMLARSYILEMKEDLSALRQAISQYSCPAPVLHKIKGGLAMVGAFSLHTQVESALLLVRLGSHQKGTALYAVDQALEQSIAQVEEWLKKREG